MSDPQPLDLVLLEQRDSVLIIRFNRPDRLNAWTDALEDAYFEALFAAEKDSTIRAVVVTGSGRGFSAGADMEVLAAAPQASDDDLTRKHPRHVPMVISLPVIAAVNGPAAGLGFVEALFCDVRFASPDALFLTSFVRRGLVAEYGSAWLLGRLVGHGRASDLMLSGRAVDAEEAYRIGLVDHLVSSDNLVDEAVAYAAQITSWCSPTSIATIKGQLRQAASSSFEESVADADLLMRQSFRQPDLAEGVSSFIERRAPRFAPSSHQEI